MFLFIGCQSGWLYNLEAHRNEKAAWKKKASVENPANRTQRFEAVLKSNLCL
jgi:hypothetical protein